MYSSKIMCFYFQIKEFKGGYILWNKRGNELANFSLLEKELNRGTYVATFLVIKIIINM